jgi:hypothetical protein
VHGCGLFKGRSSPGNSLLASGSDSSRKGGLAAASGAARSARGIMPVDETAEVHGVRRDAGLQTKSQGLAWKEKQLHGAKS